MPLRLLHWIARHRKADEPRWGSFGTGEDLYGPRCVTKWDQRGTM